jgi:biopolymer transport protein ExbB
MNTKSLKMTLSGDRRSDVPSLRPTYRWLALAFPSTGFAATAATPEPAAAGRTLLQELNLPAIWFLVACSVLIVWLVVDLYLRSARRELLPGAVLAAVRAAFRRGDFQAAYDACAPRPGLFATAVAAALRHASEGRTASEDAAAVALEAGQSRLQSRIAYLSVIGVIAPMVGLTGTVLGMIDAFAAMGQPGAADPARLSGAIGHVLHATAGGLIVAIPAFVLHYVLRSRVTLAVRAVAEEVHELFRGFPYASRVGLDFRGAERCVPVDADGRATELAGSNP